MNGPFVLVEGLDVSLYPTLDALTDHLEAQDVRAAALEAFDSEGRVVRLAAESDLSPVTAEPGELAADHLRVLLIAHVDAIGAEQVGINERDLATADLAWLLRVLSAFQGGGRSPSW